MNNETILLLEKYFDVAFAAPDGVKKLRELILSLAMQGKLVPQDPSDQSARELLKEIEAEKSRLVKEGKIKPSKPLSEIKPDEVPYDLPKSWEWIRLGSLGEAQTGATPPTKDTENFGGFIPFIGPGDIKNYRIDYSGQGLSEVGINKGRLIQKHSVLMVCIGGSIGKHAINDRDITCNQQINTITPYSQESTRYIFFAMGEKYFQTLVVSQSGGSATPIINKQKWSSIPVPLPPIAEQRRIVAKIDELMARCDELEKLRQVHAQKQITVHNAALNQLLTAKDHNDFKTSWHFITQHFGELYSVKANVTELRKAILQLAVMGKLVPQDPNDQPASELLNAIEVEKNRLVKEEKIKVSKPLPEIKPDEIPYDLPKSWEWMRLNDLLTFGPTNGFSPQSVEFQTPVRSLTLSATTSGKFKGEYSKFIDHSIPLDSDLWLEDGDILVQRGNTLEYVGVSAIYRGESNQYIYPDLMMKIRISLMLNIDYIYLAMSSKSCREFLRTRASGTSGTMPKINQSTLKSLPIPIPPLAEQHRIVAKIDQLMTLCDDLEKQIDITNSKKTNLLNSVMTKV